MITNLGWRFLIKRVFSSHIFKLLDRWDDPLIELRENEETLLEEIANILLF